MSSWGGIVAAAATPRPHVPARAADTPAATRTSLPSIALSGVPPASLRLGSSAHNIANGLTPDFRGQIVQQESPPEGGVVASIGQAPAPGHDLARDIVEQK